MDREMDRRWEEEEIMREFCRFLYDACLSYHASNPEAMNSMPYKPVLSEEEEMEEKKEEKKRKEEEKKREEGKNEMVNTPAEEQMMEEEPSLEEKLFGLFIRSVGVVVAVVLLFYGFEILPTAVDKPVLFLILAVGTAFSLITAILNTLAILTGNWAIEIGENTSENTYNNRLGW
jgi:uncharacterized membrane protein YdbT with pleckstrin-like domain